MTGNRPDHADGIGGDFGVDAGVDGRRQCGATCCGPDGSYDADRLRNEARVLMR